MLGRWDLYQLFICSFDRVVLPFLGRYWEVVGGLSNGATSDPITPPIPKLGIHQNSPFKLRINELLFNGASTANGQ